MTVTRALRLCGVVLILLSAREARADAVDDAAKAIQRNDYAGALTLVRPKAEAGDTHAQVVLGEILLNGPPGVRDEGEATRWYRVAASKDAAGDPFVAIAQFDLASLYWTGRGVAKDEAQAVKLYTQSATNGFREASGILVGLFHRGEGVEPNPVEAYKWALVNAGQGDPRGSMSLALLRAGLTPEQIARARQEVQRQFPNLTLPAETQAALTPGLEVQKGVPIDPVSPSAGYSSELKAIHEQPMANNKVLVPQLKARLTTLSPPYLFELSRRSFVDDPQEGVTLFWLARLRAAYDAARCTDPTAAQGVLQWHAVVSDVIAYIKNNPEVSRRGKLAALERETSFPADSSPQWICLHGIAAVNAALAGQKLDDWLKPAGEWQPLRQKLREQLEKSSH